MITKCISERRVGEGSCLAILLLKISQSSIVIDICAPSHQQVDEARGRLGSLRRDHRQRVGCKTYLARSSLNCEFLMRLRTTSEGQADDVDLRLRCEVASVRRGVPQHPIQGVLMVILGREPLANGLDVTRHFLDVTRHPCQGLQDMSGEHMV